MIASYIGLFVAIFFTINMVSYLVHLNDLDLPLPVKAQFIDIFIFICFSGYWAFIVYCLKHYG